MNLNTSTQRIPRVSEKYAHRLERLEVRTLGDFLFHFPHRYHDFQKITPAKKAKAGEEVCVKGKIVNLKNRTTSRKKMVLTKALLKDDSGIIQAIWFRQPYLKKTLSTKKRVCLAGEVKLGKEGLFLSNPVYEKITGRPQIHTGRLVPVYPETEGVSSRWIRYVLFPLVKKFAPRLPQTLPSKLVEREDLFSITKALSQIHFPDSKQAARKARHRFSFEELFLLELRVLKEKVKAKGEKAFPVPFEKEVVKQVVNRLPFSLTGDQNRVNREILEDMENSEPMRRLLQGDVGSGKTVVAAIAALNAAENGFQTAFMAPTEILASQHFNTLKKLLPKTETGPVSGSKGEKIGLLTGSSQRLVKEGKVHEFEREEMLKKLGQGEIDIVVGTHALIQEGVEFKNLALLVIDEQHRFGVKQRSRLVEKMEPRPHLLTMTATPIPRSLALTAYGDLDISLIEEMPEGRKEVDTRLVPPKQRKPAYNFIKREIKKGRQAFVICPRISKGKETSAPEVKTVKQEHEKLSNKVFPELRVEKLHGRLSSQEKEEVMTKFKKGEIDILVATSVIEVGVDVKNASVIMVEGAERFGLAQLHQFRGRVGRSDFKSYCFLFPGSVSEKSKQRLTALTASNDGFELAEKDLRLRGPGSFVGKRQSGPTGLMLASLGNIDLVKKTRKEAQKILNNSPGLEKYPKLKKRLKRFEKEVHLE